MIQKINLCQNLQKCLIVVTGEGEDKIEWLCWKGGRRNRLLGGLKDQDTDKVLVEEYPEIFENPKKD